MDSGQLIDAQFNRAVEIVQGLPKTGPIQTDYDEKLTMYSLYKQATVGNIKSPRPGIWDMLERAKWDAWAKHKDLDQHEAKWLYVDALKKVLRKYSDKTIARNLVQELESFEGDPANILMSGSFSKKKGNSDSSGSTQSESLARQVAHYQEGQVPSHLQSDLARFQTQQQRQLTTVHDETTSEEEEETDDDDVDADLRKNAPYQQYPHPSIPHPHGQSVRPPSSLSSHRYRTPMAGSLAMSPPPVHVPAIQPLPGYETPSAFGTSAPAAASSNPSLPSSAYPTTTSYRADSPPHAYPSYAAHPIYRGTPGLGSGSQSQALTLASRGIALTGGSVPIRPPSRSPLERAVENVQAHLAALTERLELLEAYTGRPHYDRSSSSLAGGSGPSGWRGRRYTWDMEHIGMWSFLVTPLLRVVASLQRLIFFLTNYEQQNRSPVLVIVRRLVLDVAFVLFVLAVVRAAWKKSGVRRRPIQVALKVLWRAIVSGDHGGKERELVDRGV